MSRRVYLLGVGVALVGLALALTDWALSLQPGVTEASAKRIRPGMTLAEARGILGGHGDFVTADFGGRGVHTEIWMWMGAEAEGFAVVECDSAGRVVLAEWWPNTAQRPGPLSRLRAWLGW